MSSICAWWIPLMVTPARESAIWTASSIEFAEIPTRSIIFSTISAAPKPGNWQPEPIDVIAHPALGLYATISAQRGLKLKARAAAVTIAWQDLEEYLAED